MNANKNIRFGWIRVMYIYTIIGAGLAGLFIIFVPDLMMSMFQLPAQEPIMFGVAGSVYIAFALCSFLGLRSPLKFLPILMLQLVYKTIWLFSIIIPLTVKGSFQAYMILPAVVYLTYVIGDLIAIPFPYLLNSGKND